MVNAAVWLESGHSIRRIRRAKKPIKRGDTLHIYYDSQIQLQVPEPAVLVADEGEYSIWNKPYGTYSQGSKWGDHCTIYRWAERYLEPDRPAYLVHRLDRAAIGLIILAHNTYIASAFVEMFRQHTVVKYYRAIVEGNPGNIKLPFTIDDPVDDKPAETIILEAGFNPAQQTTTVLIDIKSGRKHQIRKRLCTIGHPVVGDRLYGAKNIMLDLQSGSVLLRFTCPRENRLRTFSLADDQYDKIRIS